MVSNSGVGQDDVNCSFAGFFTNQGTAVRAPNGNGHLTCRFEGLPPIDEQETLTGWFCTLSHGGYSETRQSRWVRTPSGDATLECHFTGKPLHDAAVSFADDAASAQEASFTASLTDFPAWAFPGEVVYVGRACFFDPLLADPAGKIALIERGACFFSDKLQNVEGAGAIGAIVFNSEAGGEGIFQMNAPEGVTVDIPGVFVARSTGLALQALGSTEVVISACGQSASCRGVF